MKVKDLYNTLDKTREEGYSIMIYFDGIQNNGLAFCNGHYDVEGTNNVGCYAEPYSVKDLFEHEVLSFHVGYNSLYVKIASFEGMKHK